MRATLLTKVRDILARAGFYLSEDAALRPLSFDLVARRDGELLIIKVLTNVDGLSEAVGNELRVVAQFLDAAPLVIGERTSSRPLEDGAVYLRYGVPIITYETLGDYLVEGVSPLVYAAPGGFYVSIDGPRLRGLREERGLSLGDLAQAAGVSRRAIGMYEEGMSAMVEVAARLEEFLEESLALPIDPFSSKEQDLKIAAPRLDPRTFEGVILQGMSELGFRVIPTDKSPFAAITKEERVVLTGFARDTPDADKRALATANLCDVTETWGVFFVERTSTRLALHGTPVVSREELAKLTSPENLMRLIAERRGKKR